MDAFIVIAGENLGLIIPDRFSNEIAERIIGWFDEFLLGEDTKQICVGIRRRIVEKNFAVVIYIRSLRNLRNIAGKNNCVLLSF